MSPVIHSQELAPQAVAKPERRERVTPVVLLALCGMALMFTTWALQFGWRNSITNAYSFRQCQTAISARSIQEGGPLLKYETPVLGPPWTIPFEFPVYQALAGWSARIFSTSLEPTGRAISVLFFAGALWAAWYCLAYLGLGKLERTVVLTLVTVSPFYIFWTRAFLIESCALFFSLAYLALVLRAIQQDSKIQPWILAGIALSGSFAGTVKATTFAAFLLASTAALTWAWWKRRQVSKAAVASIALAFATTVIPIVITGAWTRYADSVKLKSPLTAWLTSRALSEWNFGTMGQRLQLANYASFGPVIDSLVGHRILLVLVLLVLIFVPRRRKEISICLALWASAILIFFNLHYIHSYYAYANGIFLIAALGFAIVAVSECGGMWRWAAVYLLAFSIGSFSIRYFLDFHAWQRSDGSTVGAVADVLTRITAPEDVLLVYGLDWSPELPYLAHRRAIMQHEGLTDYPEVPGVLSDLPPRKLGAVLICGIYKDSAGPLRGLLARLSFRTERYATVSNCDIYIPTTTPLTHWFDSSVAK